VKIFLFTLLLCVTVSGCASKSKNQTQVRRAYAAGQQAAVAQMQQAQQQQAQLANQQQVRILGPVKNSLLLWSQEMTLARALNAAEYQSQAIPKSITIYRGNETYRIDPQRVLQGEDYNLFPGDIVLLQE
jgi:hypothetical protein